MEKYTSHYDSPIGRVYIAADADAITNVDFKPISGASEKETPLILQAVKELQEYFSGNLQVFDLPIRFEGTDFQIKAWNALKSIPYGKTVSYKEQAIAIGNEKAYRAVGAANGKNPISIIVPCHRVIGTNGSPIGYGGGLDRKLALLELEKATIENS